MEPVSVYITTSDRQEALSIVKALLVERLIACANITDQATSLYWWRGEIEQETECLIIAKSVRGRAEKLIERVRALHSYENPCVVISPIESGNPDYLKWIAEETTPR